MGHVICVANLAEKAGRTFTAVNIAASLSVLEKKVLLVDCDPTGQAAGCLGITIGDGDFGLDDFLTGIVGGRAVVRKTALPFLDVIPPGLCLGDIETTLAQNPDKEKILSIVLRPFVKRYDYIIFDTSHEKNLITRSAFLACDSLLMPVVPGPSTGDLLDDLLGFAGDVRKAVKDPLTLSGLLLLNCTDSRCAPLVSTDPSRGVPEGAILPVTIPEIPQEHRVSPLCLADLKSPAAEAFLDLCFEFLYRENASHIRHQTPRGGFK
ncbi:AAA family ATPase [Desulfatiferula olefinivorans]